MSKNKLMVTSLLVLTMAFSSACMNAGENEKPKEETIEKEEVEKINKNTENEPNVNKTDENEISKKSESKEGGNVIEDEEVSQIEDLTAYPPEIIEYINVWLQFGVENIDELNVRQITAGELMNPDDETSVAYTEDVVQLTSSRLAEGSITYSSNGDGTINLYSKVPQRWDGVNPAGEDVYKDILNNVEKKSVEQGSLEKIKQMIEKLSVVNQQ